MPADWYRWEGEALLLNIRVQPGARRTGIDGPLGERLKIRIATPPVDGKANQHLIRFLTALCGVRRADVTLVRGETGRNKLIRIDRPRDLPPGVSKPDPA